MPIGQVSGQGRVAGGIAWTLQVPAGLIPVGAIATVVLPTTSGLATFRCPAAVAGAPRTCAGMTAGLGLQGGV